MSSSIRQLMIVRGQIPILGLLTQALSVFKAEERHLVLTSRESKRVGKY